MKTVKQQITKQVENRCIHFNGLTHEKCRAGVKYSDVKEQDVKPLKIPCLKMEQISGGSCSKIIFPSPKMVQKEVKILEALANKK